MWVINKMENIQPKVETVLVPGGQFNCSKCGKVGDRIVNCQRFDLELVGGYKACESCDEGLSDNTEAKTAAQ